MSVFREGNKIFSLVNYEKGKNFFDRFGSKSLLIARIAGPFSWITPFLAGVYDVPYKQFVLYNTPGVIIGIGQFLIIGYFFGSSYQLILDWMGKYGPIAGVFIGIILVVLYFFFRKRKELVEK
jgi:membrane-associated protein